MLYPQGEVPRVGAYPKLEPRNHWFDFIDCCLAGGDKKAHRQLRLRRSADRSRAARLPRQHLPEPNTRMERGEDGVRQLRGSHQAREAKLSSGMGDRGVVNAPVPPRGTKLRRLDQLLSSLGHGSRRDARECIRNGLVTVRGIVEEDPGAKVAAHDVLVEGEPLEAPDGLLAILHKPAGYICTHSEEEGSTIYDLLPERWTQRNPAVTSVGRLDKDTSGILMVTDRGDLVQQWTSPRSVVEKVYEVEVDAPLESHLVAAFASGTLMLRSEVTPCLPAKLEIVDSLHAKLTLTEGRYHQVRRMFASQGWNVVGLHRSRFGEFTLDGSRRESGGWCLKHASAEFSRPMRVL